MLEHSTTNAVLAAVGHGQPLTPKSRRPQHPDRLTRREGEVLRLVARRLTTRENASRLYISPKTADHHIQHIYTKVGYRPGPPLPCGRCSAPSSAEPFPTKTETPIWPRIRVAVTR
jgi:DNA-binding CsgD family transcriptional regulator